MSDFGTSARRTPGPRILDRPLPAFARTSFADDDSRETGPIPSRRRWIAGSTLLQPGNDSGTAATRNRSIFTETDGEVLTIRMTINRRIDAT
jgi:hypothetical protein